jgi:hypothetical protein
MKLSSISRQATGLSHRPYKLLALRGGTGGSACHSGLWKMHEPLWGSFESCAPISSALPERSISPRRGRLETGQQDTILPHTLSQVTSGGPR